MSFYVWTLKQVNTCWYRLEDLQALPTAFQEDQKPVQQAAAFQDYFKTATCITAVWYGCNCAQQQITRLASSKVSRMALGFPGKLMIKHFPRSPAVCLDNTAVGTNLHMSAGLLELMQCADCACSPALSIQQDPRLTKLTSS